MERRSFFISYASPDRRWAEWIAWQLEAEGYQVVVQAWDFGPGRDWTHEMHAATVAAERVVLVLSPDYLTSEQAEAEWGVFYAQDPRGEKGLLLPVRVREVESPGLLKTRVYVDLVARDPASARSALVAAARGARGKPTDEPEFPGDRAAGATVPLFPGTGEGRPPTQLTTAMRADELGALRSFVAEVAASLSQWGFSEADTGAFRISIRELVDNVARHVGPTETLRLEVDQVNRRDYRYHDGVSLRVEDSGPGFDFDGTLARLEEELGQTHGSEHGLLRAYRLASVFRQISQAPHAMGWLRERVPQLSPSVFDQADVVPVVYSYRDEALLIHRTVHTFCQLESYLSRSTAFFDLMLDPLLRPARSFVGIEITGQGWTGVQSHEVVLDRILAFATTPVWGSKQLIAFADTGPSEQSRLRTYCQRNDIRLFEDAGAARRFVELNSATSPGES